MNLKAKLGLGVASLVLTGALLTGAAVASEATQSPPAKTQWVEKAVESGRLTQGEADIIKQLGELRRSYKERFQADARALVEQAIKDGKLTQEQADRILKHKARLHGKGHMKFKGAHGMTEQQLKERLDAAVKSGKISQEQADSMLKRWQEHQTKQRQ